MVWPTLRTTAAPRLTKNTSCETGYAFATTLGSESLRADVLTALRSRYDVSGVIVVPRAACAAGLDELERIALGRYGSRFRSADYAVSLGSGRWRLGLVFMDSGSSLEPEAANRLRHQHDDHLEVLSVHDLMVGVLKYDQGKRIPWGAPAGFVGRMLSDSRQALLATGRSARTVRGALRLFSREPRANQSR